MDFLNKEESIRTPKVRKRTKKDSHKLVIIFFKQWRWRIWEKLMFPNWKMYIWFYLIFWDYFQKKKKKNYYFSLRYLLDDFMFFLTILFTYFYFSKNLFYFYLFQLSHKNYSLHTFLKDVYVYLIFFLYFFLLI
jgi:hypothetical protein